MDFKKWMYREGRPHRLAKILNRGWAILHSLGISPNYLVTLEVVGRKSGKTISFPLVMTVMKGENELAKQAVVDLISDLHHLEHPPKIIVLSVDPQVKATALAAGADAFISKNVPPDNLLSMLREMRQSETTV